MSPARVKALIGRLRFKFNWIRLPQPKRLGPIVFGPESERKVIHDLTAIGLSPIDLEINIQDYRRYLEAARYQDVPDYYAGPGSVFHAEKSLEHYLAAQLLALQPGDVYIDVANAAAPTPEIYQRIYGVTPYRQDLLFPAGCHGNTIGGDAAAMPLPGGFANKMALHCSFEHFEGDSDWRFIREAGRLLRPGGRLAILPLYLFPYYAIQTDPGILGWRLPPFEADAVLHCARGWRNRHGRFYDAAHLRDRVLTHMEDMRLTLYRVNNAHEVDPNCYLTFAAVFEKH